MRVLHLNSSFSSVPLLAECLNALGCEADVAGFDNRYFNLPRKYYIQTKIQKGPPMLMERLIRFGWLARHYDILHFHYHSGLPWNYHYIDFLLWRALRKKIVMHYRGDDLRHHQRKFAHWLAHAIIVSTPDLLQYEPRAFYVPNPILIGGPAAPQDGPRRLVVAHAPTDPLVKGTEHIKGVVAGLQAGGLNISLDLIENVSHDETLARLAKADIVIDQVRIGWYGSVAIEAMALGKPTLCYISLPAQPAGIYKTTPETLGQDLTRLVLDNGLRCELGQKAYVYAKVIHDALPIAREVAGIYEIIMAR